MRNEIKKLNIISVILIGVVLISCLTGCSSQENNNQINTADAERMGTNITNYTNQTEKNITEIKKNATGSEETTISEFSTKIYNKEEARQTNVRITCGKLNGTIVKVGDTFSFETVVGKATTEERLQGSRYF